MKKLLSAPLFAILLGLSAAAVSANVGYSQLSIWNRIEIAVLQFFGFNHVQPNNGGITNCPNQNAPTCISTP